MGIAKVAPELELSVPRKEPELVCESITGAGDCRFSMAARLEIFFQPAEHAIAKVLLVCMAPVELGVTLSFVFCILDFFPKPSKSNE